jgi:hypothetical protein
MEGRAPFSNSMTIYFEADLSPYVAGKPLSVIYINNPVLGGIFRLVSRARGTPTADLSTCERTGCISLLTRLSPSRVCAAPRAVRL